METARTEEKPGTEGRHRGSVAEDRGVHTDPAVHTRRVERLRHSTPNKEDTGTREPKLFRLLKEAFVFVSIPVIFFTLTYLTLQAILRAFLG